MLTNRECEQINRWYISAIALVAALRSYLYMRSYILEKATNTPITESQNPAAEMTLRGLEKALASHDFATLCNGKNLLIDWANGKLMRAMDNIGLPRFPFRRDLGACATKLDLVSEPETEASRERSVFAQSQIDDAIAHFAALDADWERFERYGPA